MTTSRVTSSKRNDNSMESGLASVGVSSAPTAVSSGDAATLDVLKRIREDILTCKFQPGQRLRTEELRSRYKVGVGTFREALSHLTAEGLVRSEAGRGFTVAPISASDLIDITELRVDFETKAITNAIKYGDHHWEGDIVSAFHVLSRADSLVVEDQDHFWGEWSERHKRFHDALVSACRSPWLLHFRNVLFDQSQRYRRLSMAYRKTQRNKQDAHRELMEAVISRNTELACRLAEEHIREGAENILEAIRSAEDRRSRNKA